jgi:predicted Zn-ribbon and HTH transcriptional regulator
VRPPEDPVATETSRQRIMEILRREEMSFEELRREMELPARRLEEDLRHVERSLRRGSERLRIDPAVCRACGFVFRERVSKHLHAPSRCPQCRSERISEPRFRIS